MSNMRRRTTIVGNWKMHKTVAEAKAFIEQCVFIADKVDMDIGIAVPFTAIYASAEFACGSKLMIGAQNVWDADAGAFTGEVSAPMLKEAGAAFVIIGHSERRQLFHESSQLVNRKVKSAIRNGLRPIVCIGETLQQYLAGSTHDVLEEQLSKSLEGLHVADMQNVVLAYEPVWAIGTDQAATPKQAQDVHCFCRTLLERCWTSTVATNMVILYGGSVRPENAVQLLTQSDIDGLLVGGSSLSIDSFGEIIASCNIKIS